jgi:hypothetical protein
MHRSRHVWLWILLGVTWPAIAAADHPASSPTIASLRQAATSNPARAEKEFWEGLQTQGTPLVESVPGGGAPSRVDLILIPVGKPDSG